MSLSEQQKAYSDDEVQAAEQPRTEPDPDHACEMLAWIGTDLVECLEENGQSCKYASMSDGFTVFCDCQPRKRVSQILQR